MTTWRDVDRVRQEHPDFTVRQIAGAADCGPEYVRVTFRRRHWPSPRPEHLHEKAGPSERSLRIIEDYRAGMIWRSIAAKHGVSLPTVWEALSRWAPELMGKRARGRRRGAVALCVGMEHGAACVVSEGCMNDWGEEWNRTIKAMPLAMYLDWVKSKRPGFSPKNNLELQSWCKTWRIAHARVPHQDKVA